MAKLIDPEWRRLLTCPDAEAFGAITSRRAQSHDAPLVTIVTPSYNQAEYIGETLRSVLLQDYPRIEYLVLDGGSKDGSVEIIRRYEKWLWWVSERDRGQTDAINKGWRRAAGEYLAWLNSDDIYLPGAITRAVAALEANPDALATYGDGLWITEGTEPIMVQRTVPLDATGMLRNDRRHGIPQPTVFLRRKTLDAVGLLDEALMGCMDREYWYRIALTGSLLRRGGPPLACLRWQPQMKTRCQLVVNATEGLAVFERTLDSPLCPPAVVRQRNPIYARCWQLLGDAYWNERRDWRSAARHYLHALRIRPDAVLQELAWRGIVWAYMSLVPTAARRWIHAHRHPDEES
jgi:glycosyltransferase involved in cell wall biosynthesis